MKALIGALRVTLGIDTAAFSTGATKAEKRADKMKNKITGAVGGMKGLGAALAGSLAIGAVTGAISRGLEYASSLGEVAQQLGVTTTELQEYRYAASQAGIEQGQMDNGLAKLTRSMGEAAQGDKAMVEAFKRLGITMDELKGKTTGEAFRMIAEGMGSIKDPAQRAAIEMDLFGKSGQKLDTLLAGGAEGIDNLTNAARELGVVLSPEQIQKADDAADKMSAMKQVMEAKIAGVVADNAGAILNLVDTLAKLAVGAANALGKIAEWVQKVDAWGKQLSAWSKAIDASVVKAFTDMWTGSVEAVRNLVSGVRAEVIDRLNAVWAGVKAKIDAVKSWFFGMYQAVTGNSYVPDMVDGIVTQMDRLDKGMVEKAKKATAATSEAFKQLQSDVSGLLDRLFPEAAAFQQYQQEADMLRKAHEKGILTADQYREALHRLRYEDIEEASPVELMDSDDLETPADDIGGSLEELQWKMRDFDLTAKETGEGAAEAYADMASSMIGSIQNIVGAMKDRDWLGALQGVVDMIVSIAGAVRTLKGGGGGAAAGTPGFRTGGSFKVGGVGNADSKLVSFRASPGEIVDIRKPGQGGNPRASAFHFDLRGAVVTQDLIDQMNRIGDQAAARGALGGSHMAQRQILERQRRALA